MPENRPIVFESPGLRDPRGSRLQEHPMALTLRPATPADAPAAGAICYHAFKTISEQHNFPPDFPSVEAAVGALTMLLAHPAVYGVIAESEGRIVGSNFLWLDGPIASIGPITVDPAAQNASIGRRLMEHVIAHARQRGSAGIRLVQAAFHNRSLSLYAKLGLNIHEPLALMQGPSINRPVVGFTVRTAAPADLDACNALCTRIHGHDRPGELRFAVAQKAATVVEHDHRIVGYATGIGFFGHAIAESNEGLQALIAAAPAFAGPGFLLPTRNSDLLRWCLAHNLRVIQPMTLMAMGLYNEPAGVFLPSICC